MTTYVFGQKKQRISVVLYQQFTGDGSDVTFQLTDPAANATWLATHGAWAAGNIHTTYPAHITKTNKKPIYDSIIPLTRNRITVSSISAGGLVTLDYAPRNNADFYVWYWYQLSTDDILSAYYRADFIASMEGEMIGTVSLYDTDSSNVLTMAWNEDSSNDRTLNLAGLVGGDRTLTLNENFTIGDGTNITITGVTAARTLTLNENLTVGDGYNGTLTYSADAKTLTVEDTAVVSQDYSADSTSVSLAGLALTGNLALAANSITGTSVDINNAEMQQLSLIGATTISAAQWGYLGGATANGGALIDAADYAAMMALLSGEAGAAFSWNSQNLTSVGGITASGQFSMTNLTLDTAADYTHFLIHAKKTAGASDNTDHVYGSYSIGELDQTGGTIGNLYGGLLYTRVTDGTCQVAVGQIASADLNAGTVNFDAIGLWANVDQEAANTVSGDINGIRITVDADGTVTGNTYLLYLDAGSNVDYGLYLADDVPSYLAGDLDINSHDGSTGGLSLGGTLVTKSAAQINAAPYNFTTLNAIIATANAAIDFNSQSLTSIGSVTITGALNINRAVANFQSINFNNSDGNDWYIDAYGGELRFNEYTPTNAVRMKISAGGDVDIVAHDAATIGLKLGGTLVTASAAELNQLDGNLFANAAVADDARGISSICTLVTNAKSDGIAAYFEGHINGITDGPTYGAGAWLNIDSGSTLGADARALDIGIYESGADCSGGNAYGLAIHMEFDDTNPPAGIYPFRINCNDTANHAIPDALIFAPNKSAIALTDGAPGTADAYLKIKFQSGEVYRIMLVKE